MFSLFGCLLPHIDEVVETFHSGKGIPHQRYDKFDKTMDAISRRMFDSVLIRGYVGEVDGLLNRLHRGIKVLDVGTGVGHAVNVLARAFHQSFFIGYDISVDALECARKESREFGLNNTQFVLQNVMEMRDDEEYDMVMAFDVVHHFGQPGEVVKRIYR